MAETKSVLELLKDIESEMRTIAQVDMPSDGMYRCTVRGALVKAYEYAHYTHSHPSEDKDLNESAFFSCASLRGICEDVIALKYFGKLKRAERDEMVHTQMIITTFEEIEQRAKLSFGNFARYYFEVQVIYSVYLFWLQCKTFEHELGLQAKLVSTADALYDAIDAEIRWPEAVTFEEMNIKPPSYILRALAKADNVAKKQRGRDS
jgi:hypothetical protein